MSYSCHRSSRFPIKIVILQNIVGFVNDTMRYAANHQIVQSKITHYNNIADEFISYNDDHDTNERFVVNKICRILKDDYSSP